MYQLSSDETHNKAGARLPLPAITKIPLFKEHELDWVETEDMTSTGMTKFGALPGHCHWPAGASNCHSTRRGDTKCIASPSVVSAVFLPV